MLPEALLVCSQESTARAVAPVLAELGIKVERHSDAMAGLTRLWGWRYDAVVVDCEGGGDEAEVVREVREVGQNRSAVTIAIIGEGEDPDLAYALGAHFVLQKPLSGLRVRRLMRVAHGLITQERRRYARHDCEGAVVLLQGAKERAAQLVNLSAGGAALQRATGTQLEGTVMLHFALPGTPQQIAPQGEIMWQRGGRLGIRFTEINQVDRVRLDRWLAAQSAKQEEQDKRSATGAFLAYRG